MSERLVEKLQLKTRKQDLTLWNQFRTAPQKTKREVRIGIVGKYFSTGDFSLGDSYISVIEAIKHASYSLKAKPIITWLDATHFEERKNLKKLNEFDCIIVPGGFGSRGIEGKINVIRYAREHHIPYLGLCYGMQLAAIEFARHVAKLKGAHTTEVDPRTVHPIIHILKEQTELLKDKHYGGTMRLGGYTCALVSDTKAHHTYIAQGHKKTIMERHRHRYEFNNDYRNILEEHGLVISGINKERNLVEIIELADHPFFVGSQFHPELQSRPLRPHPLFVGLIKAGLKK